MGRAPAARVTPASGYAVTPETETVLIAVGSAAGVGAVGALGVWALARRSIRSALVAAPLVVGSAPIEGFEGSPAPEREASAGGIGGPDTDAVNGDEAPRGRSRRRSRGGRCRPTSRGR